MKKGDKAILIPGRHNSKFISSTTQRFRVTEVFRAMTEEVVIINVNEATGNAKVRDKRNTVFYCNKLDLRPI